MKTETSNMKNVILWTGVISSDAEFVKKHQYGDYEWMQYSKYTWEYWAKKNNCHFVVYDTPKHPDISAYKVTWQRWFDAFDYIESKGIIDYDQILCVDASIMAKWDMPNIFEHTEHKFCALRGNENLKWTYESASGYQDMFPDVNFRYNDYFAAGFRIFNKSHRDVFKKLETFYYERYDDILHKEKTVKRGTDQPVVNYFLRQYDIDIKLLPIVYGVSHLYRREILSHNWQLQTDMTPFFIKYFYTWIFSGWPDRGNTRTDLMKQTWEIVKHNYE
jgi:hypothetical protein